MIKCSIICNTYNHERWIEQTIQGFLEQVVDFEFEILIHDDASTDQTQSILKKYEALYPSLIKVIYQLENQTKLGKSVSQINISRAKGEYIAICEGDDLWIDSTKLQKQVKFLDDNSDYLCVGHACEVRNVNVPYRSKVWSYSNFSKELSINEIILNRGIVFAYNSMVFRNENYEYPDFFDDFKVADIKRVIFSALKGKVYFMSDIMSVYRVGVRGSWSERIRLNQLALMNHYEKEKEFYLSLDIYTNYQYTTEIQEVKQWLSLNINILKCDFNVLNTIEYKKLSLYRKVKTIIQLNFPHLFSSLRKLRFRYWV